MNLIDYQDPRPIYEQIAGNMKKLILKGVLSPDEQIPSIRNMAMELSTNPNTVQKAYTQLESEGFIYTVKGRGNFVSSDKTLVGQRREELADKIIEIIIEAEEIGIKRKELLDAVNGKLQL